MSLRSFSFSPVLYYFFESGSHFQQQRTFCGCDVAKSLQICSFDQNRLLMTEKMLASLLLAVHCSSHDSSTNFFANSLRNELGSHQATQLSIFL